MRKRDSRGEILLTLAVLILLFSLLAICTSADKSKHNFSISARSAALYCPETKEFLYKKNSTERLPMASTTKIMTALLALERCSGDEVVIIGEESVGIEGSSAYLKAGEEVTMRELTYALMLQSANDAAVAIACYISDGVEDFATLMNERAAEMGLQSTSFENPHGLDSSEHYTTAEELAIIASTALENPAFREIASTYKKTFVTGERTRTYVNHNKLLNMYDGCIGVKTGFTKKCGRCLVGAAERDGLTFVTVTLDAPSDWADHKNMLDFGYATLEKITLAEAGEYRYSLPVLEGEGEEIIVSNKDSLSVIKNATEHEVESQVNLGRYTLAPISEGDVLGEVVFKIDGEVCGRVPLVAEFSINKKKNEGIFGRIISHFR